VARKLLSGDYKMAEKVTKEELEKEAMKWARLFYSAYKKKKQVRVSSKS
jgi:hypothetical protein